MIRTRTLSQYEQCFIRLYKHGWGKQLQCKETVFRAFDYNTHNYICSKYNQSTKTSPQRALHGEGKPAQMATARMRWVVINGIHQAQASTITLAVTHMTDVPHPTPRDVPLVFSRCQALIII